MSAKDIYMFCKKCLLEIESVKSLKLHVPGCKGLLTSEHSATVVPHLQLQKLKENIRAEILKDHVSEIVSKLLVAPKAAPSAPESAPESPWTAGRPGDELSPGRGGRASKNITTTTFQSIAGGAPNKADTSPENEVLKSPSRKKDRFTHIKNIEKTTESAIEERRQRNATRFIADQIPDKQTLLKNIELELFSKLTPDNYQDIFRKMMKYRQNLLCLIDPCEYTDILKSYSIRVNDYLNKTGKLNNFTIRREMLKYFNTIESRLLELDNFYKVAPTYDDIVWYNQSLERSRLSVAEFLPYNKHKVFQRMLNYGVFTSPILEIVKRELLNKTGFNNFVYLDISKDSERFSFYYLDSVDKKRRQWKLDCRLEEFTNDLVDNLLDYCCDMFRKFYNRIYGDNDYRENYWEKNEFFIYDQQQIIQNILLLLDKHRLMKMLQNLISENSCYTPSEIDTFNLRSDDKLQQKRLVEEGKTDRQPSILYRIHELFNDLDSTHPNLEEYIIRCLI